MVALVPPELIKVTGWLWVLPTVTLPNDTLAGVAPSWLAVTPLPETDKAALVGVLSWAPAEVTLFVVSEELPLSVTFPLTAPADFGVKVTLNEALWPAARVSGNPKPLTVKAALLAESCETVTLVPPEFVSMTAFAWL
jgi:hypothetical protein